MSDRFPFLRVYKEMAEQLPKEDRADFYDALIQYALDGKEPEPSTGAAVFQAARRMVDKWKQTTEAGRKRAETAGRALDGRWQNAGSEKPAEAQKAKNAGSEKPAKEKKNKDIKDKYINTHIKDIKKTTLTSSKRKETPEPQDVMDLFNETCGSLPKAMKLTDGRRTAIKARLRENEPAAFLRVFEKAEASDFLSGRSGKWQADFDWLMKPANWTKVLEGNYDNRGQRSAVDSLRDSLNVSEKERAEAMRLG